MTNAEKYKDVEERTKAYIKFCSGDCENCPFEHYETSHHCHFAWLELDATFTDHEINKHEVIKQIEEQIYSLKLDNNSNDPSQAELCKVLELAASFIAHSRG